MNGNCNNESNQMCQKIWCGLWSSYTVTFWGDIQRMFYQKLLFLKYHYKIDSMIDNYLNN
jgi:hypothetical protein